MVVALPATANTTAAGHKTKAKAHRAKVTKIAVTAGKPSEFAFKIAKKSRTIKEGKVVFTITNKGMLPHDFKIAAKPGKLPKNFKFKGKVTKLIQPNKKMKLKASFKKPGKYGYICTVSGHAAAGMKGYITVKK